MTVGSRFSVGINRINHEAQCEYSQHRAKNHKAWITGNLSFIVYAFMTTTSLTFVKLCNTFKVKLSFLAALY